MSERAQPFHCPYCGDENLFPREGAGAWECRSCLRSFTVQMTGMIRRPGADAGTDDRGPIEGGVA